MKQEQEIFAQYRPDRLQILAEYLIKNHNIKPRVRTVEENSTVFLVDGKLTSEVAIFMGVISLLPKIFRGDWSISSKTGEYYFIKDPREKTLHSLFLFTGLGLPRLLHLFAPGGQQILYGSQVLSKFSTGKDIGENMKAYITSETLNFVNDINIFMSKN